MPFFVSKISACKLRGKFKFKFKSLSWWRKHGKKVARELGEREKGHFSDGLKWPGKIGKLKCHQKHFHKRNPSTKKKNQALFRGNRPKVLNRDKPKAISGAYAHQREINQALRR